MDLRAGRVLAGVATILALAPIAASAGAASRPTREPPNILIILTDDQRLSGTMAVMPKTLDRFADAGKTFTNAVVTTPLCCPSRASIYSGQYTHNHGVLQNAGRGELDLRRTIQRYLNRSYTTGIAGKFINYWPYCRRPPDFDRWTVVRGLYANFDVSEPGSCRGVSGYTTTFLKDRALKFLRDETPLGRPWFLHLAISAPHGGGASMPPQPEPKYQNAPIPPFQASPSYFEADRSDKPTWMRVNRWTPERVQQERDGTLRALLSVDDMVDEIFAELDATGEADNTLAFFLSDNGWLWGEHGGISKGAAYLESPRIPLYMRWPAVVPPGTVDNRLVANIDLLPTILAATGLTGRHTMDGRSLLDPSWQRNRILLEFWSSLDQPQNPREPSFASTVGNNYQYTEYYEDDAVTPKQWPITEPFGTGPVREYYQISTDPWQLTNMLHDGDLSNDPLVPPLADQLARDRRCAGHGPPGGEPPPCP